MAENQIGRVINNQFRVDSYLYSQGSTQVYKIENLQDNRPLLMRVMPGLDDEDSAVYYQVVRRANTLSKLNHPNIMTFHGLFRTEEFSFTLEKYIDGSSLDQLLKNQEGERLPVQDALIIIKRVSAALAYAHSAGIVHGDLKPENIMVSKEGNIYLTGFKINPPFFISTVHQDPAAEANIDQSEGFASDISAEGALLFQMLTGEQLAGIAGGESTISKLAEQIQQAQQASPTLNPLQSISELSAEWAAVIDKAFEKDPDSGYPSVKEFFLALCKTARVFVDEIPDQLWAKVPVTGDALVSYNLPEELAEMPRGILSTLRLPYFQISPALAAVLGAIISVGMIGGFLFFSGFFNSQRTPKILPGYAYILDGQVTNQIPGGQPKVFKQGSSLIFGPGSLVTVGKDTVTLLLPGDYQVKIAGAPNTVIEMVQETINQSTVSVLKLHQGSMFLIAGEGSDKSRPVYIETVSGRSSMTGSLMANRFDSTTQTFSVDCVSGPCRLEAEDVVDLKSGQRSQVDSSGVPIPPSPMNLSLYPEYNLSFIPPDILAQNTSTLLDPQNTPTPRPTLEFTPTSIPPTWTPIPTLAPSTGYGQ